MRLLSPAAGTRRGWLVPGRRGAGVVLLLHGIGGSRLDMVERARFLHAAGYTVLLFDRLRERGVDRFQHHRPHAERLRPQQQRRPAQRDADRPDSLARHLAADKAQDGARIQALQIAERDALAPALAVGARVDNRLALRFGQLGLPLAPLLTVELRPRLGLTADALRPIDGIDRVGAPVLVIAGTVDRHTTRAESQRLFARAQPPKELWEVPGAGHVDFHQAARAEYEARVGRFLARALRSEAPAARPGGVPVATTSR